MGDPGTCTCKTSNDWCWACGHERKWCYEACQRGLHGYCHPERNAEHREGTAEWSATSLEN